jgi:putative colanic acid biosynthesis acetyltransferase WcaF
VGPGVTVGEGAIVGARAVAMKDVKPRSVVVGNPARESKKREITQ